MNIMLLFRLVQFLKSPANQLLKRPQTVDHQINHSAAHVRVTFTLTRMQASSNIFPTSTERNRVSSGREKRPPPVFSASFFAGRLILNFKRPR